jgi:hypothetical protein
MARYVVEAGIRGYDWGGAPTYRVCASLYTSASSKEEAIAKWHEAFSEAEKATIDLTAIKVFDVDAGERSATYYKEGQASYFNGNKGEDRYKRF